MRDLPASPDLSHLKKQARQLLRAAQAGEPSALARFAAHLPAWRAQAIAAPEAGARVTGTNALGRVLDYDRLDRLAPADVAEVFDSSPSPGGGGSA